MANTDELLVCVEGVENRLDFIEKEMESVDETEKSMGNNEKKITIESNERTVDALEKTLEDVQKSIHGDDKASIGTENSLSVFGNKVKSERETVKNREEIVGKEEKGIEKKDKDAGAIKKVEKTTKAVENIAKVKKTVEAIDTEEKTVETERTVNKKKIFSKGKENTVNSSEAEGKFKDAWETILGGCIKANEKVDKTHGNLEEAKENCAQAEEKSPETKENPEAIEEQIANEYKNIGMDNALNAMLFSEQLIEYVLNKLGHVWPSVEGARNLPKECVSTRFSKVIGEAMLAIIDSNIEKIAESYKQLTEKNVYKIDAFRTEVCITATFYFARGYSHYNFLMYAAQLSGLSAFYFASGNTQIAEASAQVLAYILNHYIYQFIFSPTFDWFNLHLEAQTLRKEIQDKKIEFIVPSGSVAPGTKTLL